MSETKVPSVDNHTVAPQRIGSPVGWFVLGVIFLAVGVLFSIPEDARAFAGIHRIQNLLNEKPENLTTFGQQQGNRDTAVIISREAVKNCASFLDQARDYIKRGGPPEPPED